MGPVAVYAEGFLKMARSARKEAEIRKAALRLFVEKGYEGTSTREIARLAGTAEGNLYRHFASKTDLARKLFEACAERMGTALQNALAGREGPRSRLGALLVGMFEFALQEPEAFAYLQQLHRHPVIWNPPPAVVLPKTYFVAVIREGIHQGCISSRRSGAGHRLDRGYDPACVLVLAHGVCGFPRRYGGPDPGSRLPDAGAHAPLRSRGRRGHERIPIGPPGGGKRLRIDAGQPVPQCALKGGQQGMACWVELLRG